MNPQAERIAALRGRIARACEAAGRDSGSVELLPVSKRQPLDAIGEAARLGFGTFGENYVQEGTAKAAARPDLRFVLLGPLQRNKAKAALAGFAELMTVDRAELAGRLGRLADELDLARPVWIQVDLWDEATKQGGCAAADLPGLVSALEALPRLPLQGFMAIPPAGLDSAFAELAELRRSWQDRLGRRLRLSMGMSADLEAAVAAGSDQVRIGTDFFGPRT